MSVLVDCAINALVSLQDCGHGWTSMKGRVAFWFDLFYFTGIVAFKLYGQKCDHCKGDRYEQPMWYPEEVNKVRHGTTRHTTTAPYHPQSSSIFILYCETVFYYIMYIYVFITLRFGPLLSGARKRLQPRRASVLR